MRNLEEISRQLGKTFAEMENAQGRAKQRGLRRARLLLLLADEMIAEAEAGPRVGEQPAADPACNEEILRKWAPLRVFTEDALRSVERGPCRGLQSVLVLRRR